MSSLLRRQVCSRSGSKTGDWRAIPGRHLWLAGPILLLAAGCGDSIHDLAAKADVAGVTAMLENDPSLLESRNPLGKTPLVMAVTSGSTRMVQTLLDQGADVNAEDNTGLTALHVAAWWTSTARAGQLLAAGADPNVRDHFGDTPLHVAAVQGRQSMTVFLVKHGASPTVINREGLTPAALARAHGQAKTPQLLERISTSEPESSP